LYNFNIKFEFDLKKSRLNDEKHGISLEDARVLWLVAGVEIAAKTEGESRFLRIGKIHENFFSCVFTVRQDRIRLISARRSRPKEIAIYIERFKDEEEK
jgi:uncharacterized DUF497 family protein